MNSQWNFIQQPYLTEKVMLLKEEQNKVVFKVHPDVNKIELKKAIERIFKVTVVKVATLNVLGKKRRAGLIHGKQADWKKAVVTLKEGDSIEYFEGA